jgi:hypothetical protein
MSSFRRIARDFEDKDYDLGADIIVKENKEEVMKLGKLKFRRFKNESQQHIYHYIFDLQDCKKIYFDKSWWYETKAHQCHLDPICEDAQ